MSETQPTTDLTPEMIALMQADAALTPPEMLGLEWWKDHANMTIERLRRATAHPKTIAPDAQ
ncbi:hypothetical protein FJZ28_01075 [Candidatus Peregrinibacteria bacterium]|nr:hypothetical protein [Candidatus Peregrinibacteria bacterium]